MTAGPPLRGPMPATDATIAERAIGRTVLVVDDNEANRYAVCYWLREAGLTTLEAGSGSEALAVAAAEHPDLIVLDIRLPDTSGFDVARTLRDTLDTATIPIVHLSASFTTSEWRTYGLELGAEAYLTHPVEPRELVATVRSLLRVRDVEEQLRAAADEAQAARRDAEAAAARATLLQDITADLARAMTAAEVADVVVARSRAPVGATAAMLAVRTAGEGEQVELLRVLDVPQAVVAAWGRAALTGDTPLAVAMQTGQPVVLPSPAAIADRFPGALDTFTQLGAQAFHAVPLVVGRPGDATAPRRALGVLALAWPAPHALAPHDTALLAALADQCAQALERAQLYETAQQERAAADEARQRAEEANRVKAEFLANMSHELRTPLNAIGGYVQLLEMELRGPITAEQRDDLTRIERAQRHLLGLINDLLNFAKLDAGRVQFELRAVSLAELLGEVEPLVLPQLSVKGIRFDVHVDDPAARVWADPEKVRQVLVNLLGNSVKYTSAGGTVQVRCLAEPTRVAIRVHDTGTGIPADKLREIFDPFVQVGRLNSAGQEGVGLGLAISREIVLAMGGEIWAESELGVGSTFVFTLPRTAADDGAPGAAAHPHASP